MSALATASGQRQTRLQHADDPMLVLLTLTHATLDAPIYVARNRTKIVSRGVTFLPYPFALEEPGDGDGAPTAAISIANVSRRIGKALEKLVEPPDCKIELVLASDPDTVERSWEEFSFTDATWDSFRMRAVLQHIEYWDEPWPCLFATPSRLPGLFP